MSNDYPLKKELENKVVAIACSSEKAVSLSPGLQAMGAEVLMLNVMEISPISDNFKLEEALNELDRYDWAILTSAYGAQFFVRRLKDSQRTVEGRSRPRICAIGPATATVLRESGLPVDLIPENFVAEGILSALESYYSGRQGLSGKRILIPRAEDARDVLPQSLRSAGALVNIVPCYRNVLGFIPQETSQRLKTFPPDLLVFTSASAVNNFLVLLGESEGQRLIRTVTTAALGPITSAAMATNGKKADILPEESTIPSLLRAIGAHFRSMSPARNGGANSTHP